MKLTPNILNSRATRMELARKDFRYFVSIYFPDYIKVPSAPFQLEMMKILQNESTKLAVFVAFRGSGKSTICAHLFPLWEVLGVHAKHYVINVCHNQNRSQELLDNIRREIKRNDLLINDFGPFHEIGDPNNKNEIILGKYDAKISSASINEGIRGTIYNSHRPDVIICDDIEDVQSARTTESRDNTWELVNSEILNLGLKNPRVVFIGNLIHNDSTMMRLKKRILSGEMKGIYKEYPIVDDQEKPLWPGMYPTKQAIENLRTRIGSEIDFLREYMLRVVPEGGQVVTPDMIHYYDALPTEGFEGEFISVDPAFSIEKQSCKTAIIRFKIFRSGDDLQLYVCPFPFNDRQREPEVIEEIKRMYYSSDSRFDTEIIVEKAGQQIGLVDLLTVERLPVKGVPVGTADKRARLSNSSNYIKIPRIFFPREGAEDLLNQILYCGTERYYDLMDAFTLGVSYFVEKLNTPVPDVRWIEW